MEIIGVTKRCTLFFGLCAALMGSLSVQARLTSKDSLEQLLKTELNDSVRVMTMLNLATYYHFESYEKSFALVNEAVALAEKLEKPKLTSRAYTSLAYCYTLSGDFSTALKYDNQSLQLSLASRDSAMIGRGYVNMGHNYFDIGKYDEAYYYFTLAYSVVRKAEDSLTMAIALHNVGKVFKELQRYDHAVQHLQLSYKISSKINDKPGEPYFFNELGDIYFRQGQYDSALVSLQRAAAEARHQQIGELQASVLTNIAEVYSAREEFATALAYYDSTAALHSRTSNRFGLAEVNLGRGRVYLMQKNFNSARELASQALGEARKLNAKVLAINCYRTLYQIAEEQKNYQEALEHFKMYKTQEDSLFSQEMLQRLYTDQFRSDAESKDLQIAALSEREARQGDLLKREEFLRNILVVVFALSIILLVTVYRSGQRRKEINSLLLKHQEEMERRSEELERLNQVKDKFFSIISHDLRSPINALAGILDIMSKGGLTVEEFGLQTKELRIRFNHTRTLLNNLLDWTLLQMDKLSLQPAKINLRKIVDENVELLTSLQTKSIRLDNQIPEDAFGLADSNTINLVIRNLMTNAIKFTNDGGVVTIAAKEEKHEWVVSVHDNGIGIKPEVMQILFDKTAPYTTRGTANEKGTGLGLILCKEFVEKNNGRIWVESKENQGSTFRFTVPMG
jgi:signal transduction histidine kinase/predicted negative regulator of RcsB-dependent stress response